MKRKKWSEQEERTLLSKYSDLHNSGNLAKLKTREKKFRPIADHVNSVHNQKDPIIFPFKWSWRDVSIKVQNMRHQYLGVKQKIRISKDEFNWKDGEIHWENFLNYKDVFGDIQIETKGKKLSNCSSEDGDFFGDCCDLGFDIDCENLEEEDEEEEDGGETVRSDGEFGVERENGEMGGYRIRKSKKGFGRNRGFGFLACQVMELRGLMMRREEKRWEREVEREKWDSERKTKRRELDREIESREMELEDREWVLAKNELNKRVKLERELEEERKRRMLVEEKREEEEMKWRERMVELQIEHEKAMMQMQAESQMQILAMMGRLASQFFRSATESDADADADAGGQHFQNLQHSAQLKPDANSPSEFI